MSKELGGSSHLETSRPWDLGTLSSSALSECQRLGGDARMGPLAGPHPSSFFIAERLALLAQPPSEVPAELKVLLVPLARKVTAPMQTTAMSATRSAYSTREAPRSVFACACIHALRKLNWVVILVSVLLVSWFRIRLRCESPGVRSVIVVSTTLRKP